MTATRSGVRRIRERHAPASDGARATDIIEPSRWGKGKRKGVPNKITRDLKDAIMNAFTQVGGEDYLVVVARQKPEAFLTLLGKLLPHTLQGPGGKPIEVVEIKQFVAAPAAAAITKAIKEGASS